MIRLLIFGPAVMGTIALALRNDALRRRLLVLTAIAHTTLTARAWVTRPESDLDRMLALDDLGLLFLSITSALFLASAFYAVGYLRRESFVKPSTGLGLVELVRRRPRTNESADVAPLEPMTNTSEAVFTGSLLFFLSTMTLVTASHHFGLLWVAVEATTLASAPLISFHRSGHALEATWKYLLICSVGIALALLGNFFLSVSASFGPSDPGLGFGELLASARSLNTPWLRGAFILIIVGYGTKMGLAPLHTWLPDAHSEAPSLVSALLSGALLNCAFLGILRAHTVLVAAGQGAFSQEILVGFGLVSMGFAAVFMVAQSDFKRMLAYSSVEHMGILALGVGLGGAASFGALLHAVNHSLTKALLFMAAGNILAAYQTRAIREVRGVLTALPLTGILWIAGFLAIAGSPPFGPFLSEFTILRAALDRGEILVGTLYLFLLATIFIAMSTIVLKMAQGKVYGPAPEDPASRRAESLHSLLPPAILGLIVLILGLYVPSELDALIRAATKSFGGQG